MEPEFEYLVMAKGRGTKNMPQGREEKKRVIKYSNPRKGKGKPTNLKNGKRRPKKRFSDQEKMKCTEGKTRGWQIK